VGWRVAIAIAGRRAPDEFIIMNMLKTRVSAAILAVIRHLSRPRTLHRNFDGNDWAYLRLLNG
jgi:hypothetical protein